MTQARNQKPAGLFQSAMQVWDKADVVVARLEVLLLILSLACMTLAVFSQVILRNFFSTGVLWFDPLSRHLLLIPVYLGASLATYKHHHIHVDAFTKFFKGRNRHGINLLVALIAAAICAVLCGGGIQFVKDSLASGDKINGVFPAWIAQLVMPYGFFMMAVRFVKDALKHLLRLLNNEPVNQENSPHGGVMPGEEIFP